MPSRIFEFPLSPLEAFKFNLMNCSFFHWPAKSLDEIHRILVNEGDFLIQDCTGLELHLLVRERDNAKIMQIPFSIAQERVQFKFQFRQFLFDTLEEFVSSLARDCGVETSKGEQFQLVRPIYRENYAGRFGYGECVEVRSSVRPSEVTPSFVRSLRAEFASLEGVEQALEKLVTLSHRNLVRLCDFSCLANSLSKSSPPLILLRFDQIPMAVSLFDKLFDSNDVLDSRRYIKWAYQAAKGLAFLMDRGILHRRLNARVCLLDAMGNLRLSDFWTGKDPGDQRLFERKAQLAPSLSQSMVLHRDGWRYLPTETLLSGRFDSTSQVWSYGLLLWQIYTHCQFGNRIFHSSLADFLSVTSGRDEPYHLPGHLTLREARQGMPEERRRKLLFLKVSERLPTAPESLGQVIPRALLSERSQRPYFSELFRIVESEKRILDMAHLLGFFL